MIILIFTVLAIYWAAFYKTPVRNLHGWVVVRRFALSALGRSSLTLYRTSMGVSLARRSPKLWLLTRVPGGSHGKPFPPQHSQVGQKSLRTPSGTKMHGLQYRVSCRFLF